MIRFFAAAAFFAACTYMLMLRFYGALVPVPAAVPVTLLGMAALCVGFALHIRRSVAQRRVGLDRTQLNPLRAAGYLAFAKASEWMAAIMGGTYLGMAGYVLPRAGRLSAAAADAPVVVAAVIASVALAAAARWLERNCMTPPNAVG